MKKKLFLISFFALVLLSLSCSFSAATGASTNPTSGKLPSPTEAKTATPVNVDIKHIREIVPSMVPGDSRIWAVTDKSFVSRGNQYACEFTFVTGPIYESRDDGHTWTDPLPPLQYDTHDCGINLGGLEDASTITSAAIIPYSGGFIIQYYFGLNSLNTLTNQKINLPYFNPIFYAANGGWSQIAMPIGNASDKDPEITGVSEMMVVPDGSGRIVAVGGDPKGYENAWIMDSPGGSWKSIPANINKYEIINQIIWSPKYGLVALMNHSNVIQADNQYQWHDMNYPEDYIHDLWTGFDGEICVSKILSPISGWDGNTWRDFDQYSDCGSSLFPPNDKNYAISYDTDSSGRVALSIYKINDKQSHELKFPDLPERIKMINFTVSRSGVIYYLTEVGLYASFDMGDSWELVYGPGIPS